MILHLESNWHCVAVQVTKPCVRLCSPDSHWRRWLLSELGNGELQSPSAFALLPIIFLACLIHFPLPVLLRSCSTQEMKRKFIEQLVSHVIMRVHIESIFNCTGARGGGRRVLLLGEEENDAERDRVPTLLWPTVGSWQKLKFTTDFPGLSALPTTLRWVPVWEHPFPVNSMMCSCEGTRFTPS